MIFETKEESDSNNTEASLFYNEEFNQKLVYLVNIFFEN